MRISTVRDRVALVSLLVAASACAIEPDDQYEQQGADDEAPISDPADLETSVRSTELYSILDERSASAICACPFVGNLGKVTIDASCRGVAAFWIIPETTTSPAFTPATAGVQYQADGFKIGSTIFKIDGSTCNTLSCPGGGNLAISTCLSVAAQLAGSRSPYPVPSGTFGNEPPAGAAAQLVR